MVFSVRRWADGGCRRFRIIRAARPIALARNNLLPIFNGVTRPLIDTYEEWRAPIAGDKFDPNVDRFLKAKNRFPVQPAAAFGNETRFNPKVRSFWSSTENISLAKTFRITESVRMDLNGEASNLFNRTILDRKHEFGCGYL